MNNNENKKVNLKHVGINDRESLKEFISESSKVLSSVSKESKSTKRIQKLNRIKNFIQSFND